jgi:hypothetical protein
MCVSRVLRGPICPFFFGHLSRRNLFGRVSGTTRRTPCSFDPRTTDADFHPVRTVPVERELQQIFAVFLIKTV